MRNSIKSILGMLCGVALALLVGLLVLEEATKAEPACKSDVVGKSTYIGFGVFLLKECKENQNLTNTDLRFPEKSD
jgi:hypothetical protein